jgi:hypothetical protein
MYSGKIAVPPGGGGFRLFELLSINFFVGTFFYVHLSILDKVVSSLYANFGTPVYI